MPGYLLDTCAWIDALLDLVPAIAVDATRLPQPFVNRQGSPHKDPMDLVIIATARHYGLTLRTSDQVLLDYTGVRTESSR